MGQVEVPGRRRRRKAPPPPLDLRVKRVVDDHHERHIAIRLEDLERLLHDEPGLNGEDRELWSLLARMVVAIFHCEFHERLLELKSLYAPLDPDTDCVMIKGYSRPRDESSDEAFLDPFGTLLERANYRQLDMSVLEEAIAAPNEMGLNYVPNLSLFEHLRVWVRGESQITRPVRTLATKFRKRMVIHSGFRRLVIALKFRAGNERLLGDYARTDALYLRLFKDVPHVDVEMHLPEQGTKVKMRMIDKASIASPVAMGIPTLAMKLMAASLFTLPLTTIGALLAAPVGAGLKSFFGFQQAKQKHLHHMIRHLYYLTLANNASVITRLVDSAEEEEAKEALLAYFMLWRGADDTEPWTVDRLDRAVEDWLLRRAGLRPDFEIGDALEKLHRLGLVTVEGGGNLRAVEPRRALVTLDGRWNDDGRLAGG